MVKYIVRYLDGEYFDTFDDKEQAVLWAVQIDGTWEETE